MLLFGLLIPVYTGNGSKKNVPIASPEEHFHPSTFSLIIKWVCCQAIQPHEKGQLILG